MQSRAALLDADATDSASRPAIAPLRIALLGYRSNPYSGGQGVYLKYLSKALIECGHSVDVISGEPYPHLDPRVRLVALPGLNLYAAPNHVTALRPHHFRSATDLIEYISMLTGGFPEPYTFGRRLVRHFKSHRPRYDVVHDNQSLCYGLLGVQALGYPVVATIHHPITMDRDIALASAEGAGERALIKRWHAFLKMQTRVARRLPHIVTVSQSSARDLRTAFQVQHDNVHVVANGIDLTDFGPVPGVQRDAFHLVSTASADAPLKGTQHLLKALAILRTHYPQLRLTVVGQTREGGPTERLIAELGIGAHVTFRTQLGTPEIRALYAQATVAVVPSEYEGFGLPAGEAMACGVPVVVAAGGALPEVVGDAGIVVPVRDPAALAAGIRRLLDAPGERAQLGERGRARIVESFNWNRAAIDMSTIYGRVIADRSRA